MELLQEIKDSGYPSEYLLARIHGRKLSLPGNWESVLSGIDIPEYPVAYGHGKSISTHTQDSTWRRFLKEPAWIYHQMNNGLRKLFRPYFMYMELNTLLICLRYKAAKGNSPEIEHLLEFSILSDKIQALLKTGTDLLSILHILGTKSSFTQEKSGGLERAFSRDGFKGVEQKITGALFHYILNMETHPLIKRFFVFITDARNIITLHKYLSWDTTSGTFFIEGGSIKTTTLSDILHSSDRDALSTLLYRHTGLRIGATDAAVVDSALQRRLTLKIRKWEKESRDIGLILNYLWRCGLAAKNLSIIYHSRGIDRDILKEELVY